MVVNVAAYIASLEGVAPPPDLSAPLAGLWWAMRDDWDRAHKTVQGEDSRDAAWVHAYLHRVEGDLGNAGHWYRQAGKPAANDSLQAEWERIVTTLLGSTT
jgi:hypothetical protein